MDHKIKNYKVFGGEIWHADSSNIGLYMCKKWIEKVEVILDILGEFHWFPKCNLSRENALLRAIV